MKSTYQTVKIIPGIMLLLALSLTGCVWFTDMTHSKAVKQDPGERTLGSVIDDDNIETVTTVNILKADKWMRNGRIVVVSYNGVVLLAGQVKSDELRTLAGDVARKVLSVRQVHNQLTVAPNLRWFVRNNDAWLTTKIKSKLLFNGATPSGHIKVVTENGVVFLMGLVTHRESNAAVNVASNTSGVQKVVSIFEYVD
jgi:osmotically-inducible protein OsmY